MKTIKIRKDIRDKLADFGDGQSVNKVMRLLLKDVEEPTDVLEDESVEYININMDDDLHLKLMSCRTHPRESFSDVISRLLDNYVE